jgi:hypothetical protein
MQVHGPPSRRPLTGVVFLSVEISALGYGHSFSARIAKNWSTWIGSSSVRTLLPVPICDRSRLVHSAAKADMAGGPNWPGVCIRSLSRIRALAPLAGALRRLRIVGGVGIVFGYSHDEPASGERLQVRLQRVSNLLGIDLPVVHVERKGF